jgi:hypothetical protein
MAAVAWGDIDGFWFLCSSNRHLNLPFTKFILSRTLKKAKNEPFILLSRCKHQA